MITVRFPTGMSITYNCGWYIQHPADRWAIYDKDPAKGGLLIAMIQASAGALVEWTAPCRIENPAAGQTDEKLIEGLAEYPERLRQGRTIHLAALKRELQDFDARTGCWK